MLHRKLDQMCRDGKEVWIYLREQGRWLERARILDVVGELVTVRYETEDEDEICSWEEILRMESIGAVAQRLATIPKGQISLADLPVSDDCPVAELMASGNGEPSDSEDDLD
ncbi:MAG: hypothetical protein OHK0012_01340 [Synechococcales cyanobacterium]